MENATKIVMHLASGDRVEVVVQKEEDDVDAEEAAMQLSAMLNELPRPRWVQIENVCAFSGAVSAIEVID